MPESIPLPMRSSAPAGSPTRYTDPKTIDGLLESSDPEAVAESGRSYRRFAAAYEKIAGELLSLGSDLHDAWSGKDAAAAQSQLREVWSAAVTVHKTASTFGIAVERHGSESLAWYKYNKPPSTDLAEAQSWMTGANERVSQSWSSLPADLATTLPPSGKRYDSGLPSTGSAGDEGGPSGAIPLRGGGRTGASGRAPHDARTASPGGAGTGSELAGLPPSGTGGVPGLVGDLPSGFVPGGGPLIPGGGVMSGPGLIGPGVLPAGLDSTGTRGLGPRMPGKAVIQAGEADTGARTGTAGPIIGGTANGQERERERRTWLAEDEEVWTGDIQTCPQLIGTEATARMPHIPEIPETPIEIDLSSDDDIVNELLEDLGADEPKDTDTEIAELRAKLERLERKAAAERGGLLQGDEGAQDPDRTIGGDG